MIKLDCNPLAHSIRYNIEIKSDKCRNCGREVQIDIPVISSDFVGFESESHEPCGEGYRISILKPRLGI